MGENDILSHAALQLFEGILLGPSPCPGRQSRELGERFHNLRVVLDEFSVEVCES